MGRPPTPRTEQRRFWRALKDGVSLQEAAASVGVSAGTGERWFGKAGGMAPMDLAEPVGRYLSFAEREEIALLRAAGHSIREIGRRLNRDPSTISRELRRGCQAGRPDRYRASGAHAKAERAARRPKPTKLADNPRLCAWVQDRLKKKHSPQQISHRLRVDFPDDESMRISHEAIYQALYVQGRGSLRRELTKCLRTGRALRKPRRRPDARRERIKDKVMISERPAEVEDRAVPGHWEGDLILGALNASAVGTLIERTTRFVMLLHLPDNHGAEAVRDAIAAAMTRLPDQLRRSLTWDQGIELTRHREITVAADLPIYFCDPGKPWQRGSNENANGLLRQFMPKGTDLSVHNAEDLDAIAAELNARPRETLGWRTPAEALAALLSDQEQ